MAYTKLNSRFHSKVCIQSVFVDAQNDNILIRNVWKITEQDPNCKEFFAFEQNRYTNMIRNKNASQSMSNIENAWNVNKLMGKFHDEKLITLSSIRPRICFCVLSYRCDKKHDA